MKLPSLESFYTFFKPDASVSYFYLDKAFQEVGKAPFLDVDKETKLEDLPLSVLMAMEKESKARAYIGAVCPSAKMKEGIRYDVLSRLVSSKQDEEGFLDKMISEYN